jgi:GT2 family glycosyltransferase
MSVEVTVVVPSHARAWRLRVLLDALAEQTLPRDRWEVVVPHTYGPELAEELFRGHELARARMLRPLAIDPSQAGAARQRNAGWRAARGRLIAFTDDDCRPRPDWLDRLVARHVEGAIVQGTTCPDPLDEHLLAYPHVRTIWADPPDRYMQTCNVLYERPLLERVGGFDERILTGEDVDLAMRALDAGGRAVAAPDAVTYHAVDAMPLLEKVRSQHKWRHLVYLVKRQPRLRQYCELGVFYKPEHSRAVLALLALAAARRRPLALLGVLPYASLERWRHGPTRRAQVRAIREIPGHWVVEIAEVGTFLAGSLRYGTLVL